MKIYIDQSGKIEDTARPTILAFSNSKSYTIKVSARTKRQLQEIFRRRGQIRLFIYRTFSILIFLLIRDYLKSVKDIIIDTEYPGHEKIIKEVVLVLIRKAKLYEPSITFKRIGNRPKVHYTAYDVFSKKKRESKEIKLRELVSLTIKNDRGLKRLKNA